jgi:hypothetical protein
VSRKEKGGGQKMRTGKDLAERRKQARLEQKGVNGKD